MIIDGKAIANEIHNEIKKTVNLLAGRKPCIAVILVGEDPASHVYVNRKVQGCEEVGILKKNFPQISLKSTYLKRSMSLTMIPI